MKIGLFSGFPPEHNAHVLNTAYIIRALESKGVGDITGLASNPERPIESDFFSGSNDSGLIAPLYIPSINVFNLYEYTDGYEIDDKVASEILKRRLDIVLLTYFPLFGARFVGILHEIKVRVLLAIKIGYIANANQSVFSSYHRDYSDALRLSDHIFASQNKDAELLVSQYSECKDKISILPKFVDSELLSLLPNYRDNIIRSLGLSDFFNGRTVGYIGRIDPEKNVRQLLAEIWPHVKELEPNARLLIVGNGSEESDLVKKYASASIRFISEPLTNLEVLSVLSYLDVLACPSGYDYTPRIPMEALMVGTEVVLNDQNFNDIYSACSHVVPVDAEFSYNPSGYNDQTRALTHAQNTKLCARPNSTSFASAITCAFAHKKASLFEAEKHTTEGFISAIRAIL